MNDKTLIRVFDMTGRILWSTGTSTLSGKSVDVPIAQLAYGTYVIQVLIDNEVVLTRKFQNMMNR
jgi:hypothetical protein